MDKILSNISNYKKYMDHNDQNDNSILTDIAINPFIQKHKNNYLKYKRMIRKQMKIGNLWQMIIGDYKNFENLSIKHHSG